MSIDKEKIVKEKMISGETALIALLVLLVVVLISAFIIFSIEFFPAMSILALVMIIPSVICYYLIRDIIYPALYYLYFRYFKKVKISEKDRKDFFGY